MMNSQPRTIQLLNATTICCPLCGTEHPVVEGHLRLSGTIYPFPERDPDYCVKLATLCPDCRPKWKPQSRYNR